MNCKLPRPSLYFACFLVAILLLLPPSTNSAKFCYSGQNSRFAQKHCSSGSFDIDYVCQKYTCEGGRSPFVLRTCALKTTGCLAGPRICKFSGGRGKCDKCDSDMLPFIFRDCSSELNCTLADELCNEYDGNGTCLSCSTDFCNEQYSLNLSVIIVNGERRGAMMMHRIIPNLPQMFLLMIYLFLIDL